MQRSNTLCHTIDEITTLGSLISPAVTPSPPRSLIGSTIQRSPNINRLLPRYDQDVKHIGEKKQTSLRGEQAVHLIPLVLLVCGFVLWICSAAAPYSAPNVELTKSSIATLNETTDLRQQISQAKETTALSTSNKLARQLQVSMDASKPQITSEEYSNLDHRVHTLTNRS